jgi:hypothetical protein
MIDENKKKAPKGKSESPWSLHIRSFWKIHFINPPEVRGQVFILKEMVGYDNRKVAQNRTSVKRDFGLPFSNLFQAQDCKEPQYVGGGFGFLKVTRSCHFMHLAKIPGMKSISKPRLPIEISTFREIMSANDYRKKCFSGCPYKGYL